MVLAGCVFVAAFSCLGHEYQDLLGLCDGMHVCTTRPWFILSSERVLGGMESEPMITPRGKSPLPGKKYPEKRIEPTMLRA